ncbi:MAG TPA: hypothetical protein H9730_10060 [Candidatus Mediterraneibacter stercoripullorum]|nr:hypothetical protein [Candidatus Mediterraneibacter stercoripullorum]
MKRFAVQMIDNSISSGWWKTIMEHFTNVGDTFEIRCWKEEVSEITRASLYGAAIDDKNEVSIMGIVTKELIEELLADNPADKEIYNKMTRYFTVNIKNDLYDIWSGHYGTEMYIEMASVKDIEFFEQVMDQYSEMFSIAML